MNALEIYAHVEKYGGITEDGENIILRLSEKYADELQYFVQHSQDDKFYYEYLTLKPRQDKYVDYFWSLKSELEDLSTEQQYKILKQMETIEVDYSLNPDSYESYTNSASSQRNPLFSLRGTCNMEKDCSCDCPCGKLHDIPCCSGRIVGCSNTAGIKNPDYSEILTDLVLWVISCPTVEALYVMHDDLPVFSEDARLYFEFAFLLKDSIITYIKDKKEVERLYLEYNEKYPCDTSEVENMMNGWTSILSEFHF